ncbi:MAG: hypothetical protein CBC12_05190 [Candidatus Puniceispirillum sp. TMED52]|nr:MAG: hypothetical protein CBC12_05190 [Candidatus Puniceispirillum sp. TMED52]RPF82228.1 MAG: hypothetical protein CBC65_000615 [Rhodothermaceae bacterium TMED105]|tara:strand:- start:2122 stop:2502 length:381 start_codon:yes stop_codon:yes gene_type:complete
MSQLPEVYNESESRKKVYCKYQTLFQIMGIQNIKSFIREYPGRSLLILIMVSMVFVWLGLLINAGEDQKKRIRDPGPIFIISVVVFFACLGGIVKLFNRTSSESAMAQDQTLSDQTLSDQTQTKPN